MYAKLFVLCRIITISILAICFIFFSYITFKHFIDGKTVTSSNIAVSDDGVQVLPAIIICREKAYDRHTEMYRLDDFLNNTMKLQYYLDDENYIPIEENSTQLKRESVYSITRGHCVVLKYIKKVNI